MSSKIEGLAWSLLGKSIVTAKEMLKDYDYVVSNTKQTFPLSPSERPKFFLHVNDTGLVVSVRLG